MSALPSPTPRTGYEYLDRVLDGRGPVLALAHRGGAAHPDLGGLENTMTAFRHAADLGYEYLETDVHTTSDGVLLAFHDSRLDRVTDAVGEVAALSHAQVLDARIGGSEEVPTLARLFEELSQVRFNIDLKSAAAVPALADFLARRRAWDRVLVGSFAHRRLTAFRRLTAGRVATSASPVEVAWFLQPSTRVAALATAGCQALQVPLRRRGLTVASAGLVRRAHAAGKHVHVWTIDDPAEMRTLLARGVDGLITDRTEVLKAVLVEAGVWRDSRDG